MVGSLERAVAGAGFPARRRTRRHFVCARATLFSVSRAMVLCAGFGSRLRPLTDEVPKPLLPLGDRSFLAHAWAVLEGAGLGPELVLNVHYLGERFQNHVEELGVKAHVVNEPVLRGTAGGIAGARTHLGPCPVVVMLGDTLLSRIPPDFAAAANGGELVLAVAPQPRGAGNVGVGAGGAIVRLRAEQFGEELSGGVYVGLLALGETALAQLPEQGCYIGDYALPELRRGGTVKSYAFTDDFVLPGDDLPGYLRGNLRWLEARGARSFVAPGARVTPGVALERSIVGRGAAVEGRGLLEQVVVLPGARVKAPLRDAIVAPSGRVVAV